LSFYIASKQQKNIGSIARTKHLAQTGDYQVRKNTWRKGNCV